MTSAELVTRPVTPDRVEDFLDVVNPNRRDTHCFCMVHRLRSHDIEELGGREAAFRALCEREHPPGVVGYDADGVAVGWCNIGPRSEVSALTASRKIRPIDDVPVWSIVCTVIRGGHRRRGYTRPLVEGAVSYAFERGAPAVETYPVDAGSDRIDTTMAFVGTVAMFADAGFEVAGETDAVASRRPRIVMRRWASG